MIKVFELDAPWTSCFHLSVPDCWESASFDLYAVNDPITYDGKGRDTEDEQ